jgi:membrane protease YdiL (CAAX protease family)
MPDPAGPSPRRPWPLVDAAAASAGLCAFALFAHTRLPAFLLAACGLVATTLAVQHSMGGRWSASAMFGLGEPSRKTALVAVAACVIGAGLGVLYRVVWEWGALPARFETFALAAALIGAAEEIVYRGYVQGRLKRLGWALAVVLAAAAHTAYKSALFAFPPEGVAIDLRFLAVWTFVGGVVFGLLRESSNSVLPPVAAHVCFDLVVYGDRFLAPWWVWS